MFEGLLHVKLISQLLGFILNPVNFSFELLSGGFEIDIFLGDFIEFFL